MKTNTKVAFLAVTLTLSASAHAGFWKDIFEKFDSVNKEEKNECAKMSNEEVAALCVEEVCGDPSQNPIIMNAETIQRYDIEKNKKLVAETEAEFKKRQATIEDNVKNATEAIAKLKNIKEPSQLSDTEAESIIAGILKKIQEDHKLLQKINISKPKERRVNLVVPPTSPYRQVYKDVISQLDIEKEPLCDDNCKRGIISYFQKAEFFNPQELMKKEQEKFAFEDAMAECSASAMLNHVEAKSSEEIQKEWPKLIKRLEDDQRLKLSAHSKGLILQKIQTDLTVQFNVPVNLRPALFKTTSLPFDLTGDISDAYSKVAGAETKKYFKKSIKTPRCVAIKKSVSISDHVAYKKKDNTANLVVSPFSCEHVHLGKSIMAHELGHAVSYFIANTPGMSTETKEGFKKLRECSRAEKRSTKFPGLFSPHEGDKWTTEEDTADLFSHALSDDNETMMSCALTAPDGQKYTGLKMRKSFIDTHSSGIQRLMVELQYKNPGKITEACEEVIKRSKAKIKNLCL